MNQETIRHLEKLIEEKPNREKRGVKLLKPHDSDGTSEGWAFCIPPAFNDSLDIRLTSRIIEGKQENVWTQGSSFNFKAGEILYDSPEAYSAWNTALAKISHSIQIEFSSGAGLTDSDSKRSAGMVKFKIFKPDNHMRKLVPVGNDVTMSQDEFVKLLILGM